MTRRSRTPQSTPESQLLSATDAAQLLGIGRTRFWQVRKQFDLKPVSWSKPTRPLYRRDDVLKLVMPQGVVTEGPQVEPPRRIAFSEWMKQWAHLPELPDVPDYVDMDR